MEHTAQSDTEPLAACCIKTQRLESHSRQLTLHATHTTRSPDGSLHRIRGARNRTGTDTHTSNAPETAIPPGTAARSCRRRARPAARTPRRPRKPSRPQAALHPAPPPRRRTRLRTCATHGTSDFSLAHAFQSSHAVEQQPRSQQSYPTNAAHARKLLSRFREVARPRNHVRGNLVIVPKYGRRYVRRRQLRTRVRHAEARYNRDPQRHVCVQIKSNHTKEPLHRCTQAVIPAYRWRAAAARLAMVSRAATGTTNVRSCSRTETRSPPPHADAASEGGVPPPSQPPPASAPASLRASSARVILADLSKPRCAASRESAGSPRRTRFGPAGLPTITASALHHRVTTRPMGAAFGKRMCPMDAAFRHHIRETHIGARAARTRPHCCSSRPHRRRRRRPPPPPRPPLL